MTDDGPIKALNVALLDDVGHDQAVRLKRLIEDARGRRGLIKIAVKGVLECLGLFVIWIFIWVLLEHINLCPDGMLDYDVLGSFFMLCVIVPLSVFLGYSTHLEELYIMLDDKIEGGH